MGLHGRFEARVSPTSPTPLPDEVRVGPRLRRVPAGAVAPRRQVCREPVPAVPGVPGQRACHLDHYAPIQCFQGIFHK